MTNKFQFRHLLHEKKRIHFKLEIGSVSILNHKIDKKNNNFVIRVCLHENNLLIVVWSHTDNSNGYRISITIKIITLIVKNGCFDYLPSIKDYNSY